jgi:hypothetical protein
VIRDKNGEYDVGEPQLPIYDEHEEPGSHDVQEDESKQTWPKYGAEVNTAQRSGSG